jgi:hypothetical protein
MCVIVALAGSDVSEMNPKLNNPTRTPAVMIWDKTLLWAFLCTLLQLLIEKRVSV